MRICDACGKPATDRIKIERNTQEFDICEEHLMEVIKVLQRIEAVPKRKYTRRNAEQNSE